MCYIIALGESGVCTEDCKLDACLSVKHSRDKLPGSLITPLWSLPNFYSLVHSIQSFEFKL